MKPDYKVGDKVRITSTERVDKYRIGDVFVVREVHHVGSIWGKASVSLEGHDQIAYNTQIEPVVATSSHEGFTYGQRVTRQDGCIRCFVAYTSDGNIITNHDVEPKVATYLAPRSIIWSLEDSKQFIAYVKPPVHKELTMSELEEALGYKVKIVK